MIKLLKQFPTTLDIEIFYLCCNIWWFITFITPRGIFSGVAYNRVLDDLGNTTVVSILASFIVISILAFLNRDVVYVALIVNPMVFTYLGITSINGTTIAFNAGVYIIFAILGAYRLFSHTYFQVHRLE